MALDTYANLQTAIITWAWRTDDTAFEAQVPDFITLAHNRIERKLRVADMEDSATITLTSGSGSLPSDFLQARRVVTEGSPSRVLSVISPDEALQMYPDALAGSANFYTIIGSTIKTYPASSSNLTLSYYAKIPVLSDAEPTNWLLEKAPELYLYGALVEAAPYMQDDQRVMVWGQLYERAFTDLQKTDEAQRWSGAAVRVQGATP